MGGRVAPCERSRCHQRRYTHVGGEWRHTPRRGTTGARTWAAITPLVKSQRQDLCSEARRQTFVAGATTVGSNQQRNGMQ